MMNGMLQTTVGTCVHVQVWTCTGIDQGPQAPRKLSQAEGGTEGGREGGREEWTEKGEIKRGREEGVYTGW